MRALSVSEAARGASIAGVVAIVADSASSDEYSAGDAGIANGVGVSHTLVAGDCRASVINREAAGAVANQVSARRADSTAVFPVIAVDAGIAGLGHLVAGVAFIDVETAGHTGSGNVDDVVSNAEVADREGSDGNRGAQGAVRDVACTKSTGVGCAEEVTVLACATSSGGSIVGAGEAIGHIINAGYACLSTLGIVAHIAEGTVD